MDRRTLLKSGLLATLPLPALAAPEPDWLARTAHEPGVWVILAQPSTTKLLYTNILRQKVGVSVYWNPQHWVGDLVVEAIEREVQEAIPGEPNPVIIPHYIQRRHRCELPDYLMNTGAARVSYFKQVSSWGDGRRDFSFEDLTNGPTYHSEDIHCSTHGSDNLVFDNRRSYELRSEILILSGDK